MTIGAPRRGGHASLDIEPRDGARLQRSSRIWRQIRAFSAQPRQCVTLCAALLAALSVGLASAQQPRGDAPRATLLTLEGPVSPPVAQYLEREIGAASDRGDALTIIEIDTPGGLVDSMKTIIKAVLASETPVATYVSPQGARSASAGLYIMYAAHISAMAPATNTGAATPVDVGGAPPSEDSPLDEDPFEENDDAAPSEDERNDAAEEAKRSGEPFAVEEESESEPSGAAEDRRARDAEGPLSSPDALRAKVINDSVAYIRALAEERGRNADWAEKAVREAASVSANQALELGVIDLIADDLDDLLAQIDGREVRTAAGPVIVAARDLRIERAAPTTIERILAFIANPNVAVILMSLATTGIIIEMWNPGSIFPGLVGVVCLVLGLYSFQVLPFNWLPLALMGVGAILIAIEAFTPTFGLAGLSGLAIFGIGMYFLFPEALRVSPGVIAAVLAAIGALLALILFAIIGSRSHGPMIGGEAVRRREGVVDSWDGAEGWVIIEGERWRARTEKGADRPLAPGDKIKVTDVEGLVLVVKQARAGGLLGSLNPGAA